MEEPKQFKDLSIIELKAMAYDAIAQKEYWYNRLSELNQAIVSASKKEGEHK